MVTFSSSYTPPYPLRKVNIGTFSDWVSGVHQSKLQSSSPSHQAPVAKLQPSSSSRQAPASRQAPLVKLCSHQASVALHQSKLQSPSSRRHHYTVYSQNSGERTIFFYMANCISSCFHNDNKKTRNSRQNVEFDHVKENYIMSNSLKSPKQDKYCSSQAYKSS